MSGEDTWTVAGRTFRSRLIVGTGKYKDYATNAAAAEAAGAEIVTVAVRRVNLSDPSQPMLVDFIKPDRFTYLPNTAGCFTGEDAVRTLRLAREAGDWSLVKLEVLSDTKTLYPDMEETLRALKPLVKEGFDVMVYCSDDPVYARKLEDAGAAAIMPLRPIAHGTTRPLRVRFPSDEAVKIMAHLCPLPNVQTSACSIPWLNIRPC
jgi:thiazole synthase